MTRISIPSVLSFLGLVACGTTYGIPTASPEDIGEARVLFMEEQNAAASGLSRPISPTRAAAQFEQVVARVEPVAEAFCRSQVPDEAFNCNVEIFVDMNAADRNAAQTYNDRGQPIIVFTAPLILDARSPDEIAFVLGHEFGHHIARHLQKQEQQAIAGAIVLGALVAYGQASASYYDPYRNTSMDHDAIEAAVAGGAALGQMAYSQTYELEADLIGTYIAEAAGYDPVEGARFFARPEAPRTRSGTLSFWGTHPPSEARLATVIAVDRQIQATAQTQ